MKDDEEVRKKEKRFVWNRMNRIGGERNESFEEARRRQVAVEEEGGGGGIRVDPRGSRDRFLSSLACIFSLKTKKERGSSRGRTITRLLPATIGWSLDSIRREKWREERREEEKNMRERRYREIRWCR